MIRAVLFDLDGTLLDSAPDLVGALNALRARHGYPELSVPAMQPHAARGALGLLHAGMPSADEATIEQWRREFLELYQERSFALSSLYPGVTTVLDYLRDADIPWGVVTNKPEFLTSPILQAAGLREAAACVVCGDTIEQRKPHPAPVLLACRRLGVDPRDTVFVGDDTRDIEAGIAAGTRTCAVLYGYGSAELFRAENAAFLENGVAIDHPEELMAWLKGERQ